MCLALTLGNFRFENATFSFRIGFILLSDLNEMPLSSQPTVVTVDLID